MWRRTFFSLYIVYRSPSTHICYFRPARDVGYIGKGSDTEGSVDFRKDRGKHPANCHPATILLNKDAAKRFRFCSSTRTPRRIKMRMLERRERSFRRSKKLKLLIFKSLSLLNSYLKKTRNFSAQYFKQKYLVKNIRITHKV